MGLVGGSYDAKAGGEDGFAPGGASLHVASTPHGPDERDGADSAAEQEDNDAETTTNRGVVGSGGGVEPCGAMCAHLRLHVCTYSLALCVCLPVCMCIWCM